jgi:four helix bundle protein
VILTYKIAKQFPSEEIYALTSQVKRAAVSIPSNIAEGYGRNGDKSLKHFLNISRGSLYELETQMIIASELQFVKDEELYNHLLKLIEEESKMINSFSAKLGS